MGKAGGVNQDKYRVMTWDMDWQSFTPQDGVPSEVYGKAGLRAALRALRNLGYQADKGDSFVSVELM